MPGAYSDAYSDAYDIGDTAVAFEECYDPSGKGLGPFSAPRQLTCFDPATIIALPLVTVGFSVSDDLIVIG